MAARHSRLQRQVLQLYKQFLRLAEEKSGLESHVKYEFRKWARLERSEVMRIEHLLRRGQRQLEMLQKGRVDRAGTFVQDNSRPPPNAPPEKS